MTFNFILDNMHLAAWVRDYQVGRSLTKFYLMIAGADTTCKWTRLFPIEGDDPKYLFHISENPIRRVVNAPFYVLTKVLTCIPEVTWTI